MLEKLKVLTDASGTASIVGLPAGMGQAWVQISDPRFIAGAQGMVPVSDAEEPKPLVAKPGGSLTGRVVFADHRPAADMSVAAQGVGIQEGGANGRTDANGAYTLTGLPMGRFNVSVNDPSGQTVAAALEKVQVTPGTTAHKGRFSGRGLQRLHPYGDAYLV